MVRKLYKRVGYSSAAGNLMVKDGSLIEVSSRRKKEVLEVLGMKE